MLQGWRSPDQEELVERIVKSSVPFSQTLANEREWEVFKAGALNVLLLLKCEILPREYDRSKGTKEFQAVIEMACARLQEGT